MKKLITILVIVVVVIVAAVVVSSFLLGSVVTAGVNRIAPQITQTKVTLGGATVSPLTGSGTLKNFVIGNPEGWGDRDLASLGSIHVSVQPFSILGDHIVVNEIDIEAPVFNYETKLVSSNVGALLKNIEAATGGSPDAKPATKDGKPIKFEVKKFRLTNGKVRLGAGGSAAGLTLPMPDIELTDLGTKEGGITADQLAFAVMKNVTGSIVTATTHAAGEIGKTTGAAAANAAGKAADKVGEGFKKLFGR